MTENPHCIGCVRDNPDCLFCWRREDLALAHDDYASKMRVGKTPFFRSRTGRGQWGTGPERRAAAIRGAERRG